MNFQMDAPTHASQSQFETILVTMYTASRGGRKLSWGGVFVC